MWRAETTHVRRSHSTNLAQIVLENIHYRMYNGYCDPRCPETLIGVRGYKLNDPWESRKAGYKATPTESYLRSFTTLTETDRAVVDSGSTTPVSSYFAQIVRSSGQAAGPMTGRPHPEIAQQLKDYRVRIDVHLHKDDRTTKEPSEPEVDMAQVDVTMKWKDVMGSPLSRTLSTRLSRHIFEQDPLGTKRP